MNVRTKQGEVYTFQDISLEDFHFFGYVDDPDAWFEILKTNLGGKKRDFQLERELNSKL